MGGLEIGLLGEVTLRRDGRGVTVPPAKALELLGYLLAHRDRAHHRDALAATLSPGEDAEVARRTLRQALWKLNATLEDPDGGPAFAGSPRPGWLRATPGSWARLDVEVLEDAALTAGPGEAGDAEAARLAEAVGGYRGDFLAGWDQAWCQAERRRLQDVLVAMLERLVGWCTRRGLFAQGADHGRRALAVDPARESVHRRLMRLHHAAGDRPAVVRQFRHCGEALADELGIAPSAETVALYRTLRDDGAAGGSAAAREDGLAAVHRQLDTIQATVEALTRLMAGEGGGGGPESVPAVARVSPSDRPRRR